MPSSQITKKQKAPFDKRGFYFLKTQIDKLSWILHVSQKNLVWCLIIQRLPKNSISFISYS